MTAPQLIDAAAQELLETIEATITPPLLDQSPIRDTLVHLRRIGPAWPVRLAAPDPEADRRGAMLAGPLFTSAAWPWPREADRWCEPVLQVDLAVLGALGGIALGEGWLQVWATDGRGVTRVVPAREVALAPLTPMPSADAAAYHQRLVEPAEGEPGWFAGHAITGFDEPFLDYGHNELDFYADWLLDEPPSPLPPDVVAAAHRLKAAIAADRDWYRLTHRAFGMVNEGDVAAIELPPVLWVLEEGAPLRESGNSNDGAYVCYERDADGALVFSVRGLNL